MTEPVSPASFSPNRPWKIGVNVLVSVIALLAILGMVNYLAARHPRRWMWSSDARFQLTPVTKEVLRGITNDVQVIVFFDRTKPLYDMVADLLNQYKVQCPRLKVEHVDYERSPGRAKAVQSEYALAAAEEGDRVVFAVGGKRRVVYAKELSEFDYNALLKGQEVRRTGFKGEQLFTSAIYSLADARPVRACFLQGHGEHDPTDADDQRGYVKLAHVLEEAQIKVAKLEPLALLSGEVPSDCELLIIANPIRPLAQEELDQVQRYLNSGGRLFVLLSKDSIGIVTGLEKLLAGWGVDVGRNVVRDAPQGKAGDAYQVIVTQFANHPVANPLARSRLLLILPRSIGARTQNPQSADAPKVAELATTGPDGVAGRPDGRIERQGSPVPLIVAVEKGAIKGMAADRGASRIVVVGDSYFLNNKVIEFEANRDFARNAVNWLLNRDALVPGIGAKSLKEYRIVMTASEMSGVRWLFLAGFPGGVLLVGIVIWMRRRA